MKTRNIFGMMAAVAISISLAACSDNVDGSLEPTNIGRTLTVTAEGMTDHTFDLGAESRTVTVDVESNSTWTVKITKNDGGWFEVDAAGGRGNGSFNIRVLDNMNEVRRGQVVVAMTESPNNPDRDRSVEINIVQEMSNVRLSPSTIPVLPPTNVQMQTFEVISNTSWTLDITYDDANATQFLNIVPLSGTIGSHGVNRYGGINGARFGIEVQDNYTAVSRKAFLTLESLTSRYTVEIIQNKADYTFDVSPLTPQIIGPEGGEIPFGVLSLSEWHVLTTDPSDWITFSPTWGYNSPDRQTTIATVMPNPTPYERRATVWFKPQDNSFDGLSVSVIQPPFDFTFVESHNDNVAIMPENGGDFEFEIDSNFDWEIDAPGWLDLTRRSGEASGRYQTVGVTVPANASQEIRVAYIRIIPRPTMFGGAVTIDPEAIGLRPLTVAITQYGGRQPAVSVPWLLDGYSQREATLGFSYYSPNAEITGGGLEWRKVGDSNWNRTEAYIGDRHVGSVNITLTGLDPATQYEARGYVFTASGTYRGSATYPFTTAGQRPGPDDNPTPGN